MPNPRNRLLVTIFFVLWLFFVLTSFFVVQKPFTGANAAAVGNVLLDALTAAWLSLVALGLGRWLLLRLLPQSLPAAGQLIFGTALGLGLLSLMSLAVGLAGGFNRPVAYGLTLALTAAVLPSLRALWQELSRRRSAPAAASNRPNGWTAFYLAAFALLALLVALLPPTDWDGLFYHLTAPKLYLQAGAVVGGFDVPHFSFPALLEMLFAWAMLLRGDIAAKLLHFVYGLLLAGLVGLTTHRFLSAAAVWRALLLLASMPMLYILSGWAYNDLALAFYQLAAIYWLIEWAQASRGAGAPGRKDAEVPPAIGNSPFTIHHSPLILSGLFAGLAMGLKYTSFVTPLFIIIAITYYATRNTQQIANRKSQIANSKLILSSLAAFSLPALLIAAPWYLKNWAFTGNPVFPFATGLFGGQPWDAFRAEWYAAAGSGIGLEPLTLLGLPWLLTLGVQDMNFWDGRTGPLLLLFLPLLVWAGLSRQFAGQRVPPPAKLLLAYALAHFTVWALGVVWSRSLWQSRLLLPGLVALPPVAGWLWLHLPAFDLPRFRLSHFVNIAIGLTLALTLVDTALLTLKFDPLPYLTGLESRPAYLERRLGAHYAAMQQLNAQLPPEAVVQFLWEPRSYYCQLDCRPDSILDAFPHAVQQYGSAAAIAGAWRQNGITHVLLHRDGLSFVLNEQPTTINQAILTELEQNYWVKLFDIGGAYQMYALREEP
ncbi:MAG: hypothetical protein Kow0031_13530 [Anaerolineae bacterium]